MTTSFAEVIKPVIAALVATPVPRTGKGLGAKFVHDRRGAESATSSSRRFWFAVVEGDSSGPWRQAGNRRSTTLLLTVEYGAGSVDDALDLSAHIIDDAFALSDTLADPASWGESAQLVGQDSARLFPWRVDEDAAGNRRLRITVAVEYT